jgi:hypothetical protein
MALTNYTLTLTETSNGIGDHPNYRNRRDSALIVADNWSVTNQSGGRLTRGDIDPHDQDRHPQASIYTWYVRGEPDDVRRMIAIFHGHDYVHVAAQPPL